MGSGARVLVATARVDLQSAVRRLVVLAGAELDVVVDVGAAGVLWRTSCLVIVGADLARTFASAGLPRRPAVVIVGDDPPGAADWQIAVALGATEVYRLPDEQQALVELLSAALDGPGGRAATCAVIGGCGGAGASTLAAALALAAAGSEPSVLIDADRLGGGIDVLLGAELRPGARWHELADARGHLGSDAFAQALLRIDRLAVLPWDRDGRAEIVPAAADAVLSAATRAFSTVVIDLPRHLDPASLVFAGAADVVLLVVPATVRATAAAATVAASVLNRCPSVSLVVRDPGPGRLAVDEVAAALTRPVAATLHSEAWVSAAAERGEPPVRRGRRALHDACQLLLADLTGLPEVA